MPSLHVGGHWLLMLWARRLARPLFMPAVVGTFLTFLGSLVTGWHYAVDGYIGIVLAQTAYWLALFFERDPANPETNSTSSPEKH
jgi:membrane-associated phospholipid phosphatase